MRVKRGATTHAKHKKIFRANKGFRMTKRRLIRVATEAHLHAGEYAFQGRKQKKRDFRRLWIMRIGEAVRLRGISYSAFIRALKTAKITIDRKILSALIIDEPKAFDAVVDQARKTIVKKE